LNRLVKIAVAGGTGFIGEPLVRRLVQRGDDVAVISRRPERVRSGRGIPWDAADEIGSADAVINLAGENIGARWTEARKRRIFDSRVKATTALVDAMKRHPEKKRTFVSGSAVGFYGLHESDILDESSSPGTGFLAEVTQKWEALAKDAEPVARVVLARFGVVLGKDGGALQKLLIPFRLGAGGPVGSGEQWMSWVDRDDVIAFIEWAIDRPETRGVYNVTAPDPRTNREFTKALGRAVHRPAVLPAPGFALRLVFGEMADETLLGGQRVVPAKATGEGFVFRYATLDASLRHALGDEAGRVGRVGQVGRYQAFFDIPARQTLPTRPTRLRQLREVSICHSGFSRRYAGRRSFTWCASASVSTISWNFWSRFFWTGLGSACNSSSRRSVAICASSSSHGAITFSTVAPKNSPSDMP
jgi:uncharacterized protein (TIGR01777 family)